MLPQRSGSAWYSRSSSSVLFKEGGRDHGRAQDRRRHSVRSILWTAARCPSQTWWVRHARRGRPASCRRSEHPRRRSKRASCFGRATLPKSGGLGTLLPRPGRASRFIQARRLEPYRTRTEHDTQAGPSASNLPEMDEDLPRAAPRESSADKGIIVTTGSFTAQARREATRDGVPPIELIDGEKLIDMLENPELGLRPVTTYEVTHAFFSEFKEN